MKSTLAALIDSGEFIVAPGAYDAITARLVEDAGFPAVYMTGGGTSAAHGFPDFGLLTMSEMVSAARRLSDAVSIPVIADADTGYGNVLNVVRTVREYERAGVAAIQLEDQVFPKRCGHLGPREVVPVAEFAAKIRAAASERTDRSLLIVARTDALGSEGLSSAIERMGRAFDEGADVAFVEAPRDLETIARIPVEVPGPCLLSIVHGSTPAFDDIETAKQLGFRMVIVPGLLHMTTIAAGEAALAALATTRRLPPLLRSVDVKELFEQVGASRWDALGAEYERDSD